MVWLWVLHHKIQAGPEGIDESPPDDGHDARGFLDAGAERASHHESMTEAKEVTA